MKRIFIAYLLLLSACTDVTHVEKEKNQLADITDYKYVTIGKVTFAKDIENADLLEKNFSEKLKTSIYQQGMGTRYVKSPREHTLVINANINEFDYGAANLRMAFGVIGNSKINGTIRIDDEKHRNLMALNAQGMSPPAGGIIAGFANSDILMNMIADKTINEIKPLLGETN